MVAVVFWLAVWQVTSMVVAQEILVPGPMLVATTLGGLASTAAFWAATGWSLIRMLAGFVSGVVVGTVFAVGTHASRTVDLLASGPLRVIRATPVASFVILALVWIPTGRLPAFVAFAMVVPLVWETMAEGLRHQDRGLLEMARVFGWGRWQMMRRVQAPLLLPFFTSASTNAMGLAWKSGVAAEVISRPEVSIGRSLQDAKVYLETPQVFAWTITAVALSLLLEKLLRWALARWTDTLPDRPRPAVIKDGAGDD